MSCCCVAVTVLLVIILLKLVDKIRQWFKIPEIPYLEDTWWGPEEKSDCDTNIRSFKIEIKDEVLADLQNRLKSSRSFINPLEGIQHQYGINTQLLKKIITYWQQDYDWKEREKFLNKFSQFIVNIQGLDIHYLHVKPENTGNKKVLPLLLLHGWPGSVREFYEIIPILTSSKNDCDFVFEVIVPSLPGYGFSQGAVRPGLGAAQVAVIFKNLMKKIGHERYYVQGGDWGAVIVQIMATLYPNNVLGLHSNMCNVNSLAAHVKLFLASFWPTLLVSEKNIQKVYPRLKKYGHLVVESGYMHLQATKPDTLGVGLNDSPVGLAAYILEKFITWTNPNWVKLEDGGLLKKYSYEALLDNVMIYWVTNSITTSMRLYAETISKSQSKLGVARIPITVPSACARFTYDLAYTPDAILAEKFKNIVHTFDYDAGHFAAFEEPQVLADDIFTAIQKMELYHKYNSTRN